MQRATVYDLCHSCVKPNLVRKSAGKVTEKTIMTSIRFMRRTLPCLVLAFLLTACGQGGEDSGLGGADTSYAVSLSWSAPTTNEDGSPLQELAGFKVYYGTSPGVYTEVVDVGNVTSYGIPYLDPGTYYFAATAYTPSSVESEFSNETTKTILP